MVEGAWVGGYKCVCEMIVQKCCQLVLDSEKGLIQINWRQSVP